MTTYTLTLIDDTTATTETETVEDYYRHYARPDAPDGRYYIHPEGSCWECYDLQDGGAHHVSSAPENETHRAARDGCHVPGPRDGDEMLVGAEEIAVLMACGYGDRYAECMAASRANA